MVDNRIPVTIFFDRATNAPMTSLTASIPQSLQRSAKVKNSLQHHDNSAQGDTAYVVDHWPTCQEKSKPKIRCKMVRIYPRV